MNVNLEGVHNARCERQKSRPRAHASWLPRCSTSTIWVTSSAWLAVLITRIKKIKSASRMKHFSTRATGGVALAVLNQSRIPPTSTEALEGPADGPYKDNLTSITSILKSMLSMTDDQGVEDDRAGRRYGKGC